MLRRLGCVLLAAILELAALPAGSQVGRVSTEASVAPAACVSAALTPGPARALAATLAAPTAQPLPVSLTEQVHPVAVQVLTQAAQQAAGAPERIGRLYDSAPAAPDFTTLSPIKTPKAPAPWRPGSMLLKPAAAFVNAWRLSRHTKRLNSLGPGERLTLEEIGMQDKLSAAHEAISKGRLQDALESLTRLFRSANANSWYRANPAYQAYQYQGHAYLRFVERSIKLAYERAHGRSRDSTLIAEAQSAAFTGNLLGHEWRITPIQDRGSAHCAHHALFNAIQASVGFGYPLSVHRFIERAQEALNVRPEKITGLRGAELAAFENNLGLKLGVDVGSGMDADFITRWARLLGLSAAARGPPRGDAEWSALLGRGQEVLISLRMFHERFKHTSAQRHLHGHDYEMLHHAVYLLGAFDSPSRGARLYMVQDSGSGATDFYTAEELTAVASDLQILETASPVILPVVIIKESSDG
ncbi:MAG TPA: hypothetical protein DCZ01_07915 [Elusimicrobia bacterium]|nr:MAG: hypothetical protein A2X37_06070 [Elusimicrobia bacterium GWA2_66_18]OGR68557.1 MAG: hypothetical protein A2X40_12425 [Elusimicrobia bacterium GWC2_65_9]HAZ08430.1 hypothetical protein [Elusimicrobiota bacterium]